MADPALDMFNEYESLRMARIESCIQDHDEEGQFLEFKELLDAKGNPVDYKGGKLEEGLKRTLAEYWGGFANGEGGLLVWGIKANNDVAEDKSPIANIKALRLQMEDLTSKLLDPPVDGLKHLAIEDPSYPDAGYIVTYVPEGKVKPHQSVAAKQFSFFLRTNASTTVMRTPTVRAYMIAGTRPSLTLESVLNVKNRFAQGSIMGNVVTPPTMTFAVELSLRNNGTALTERPAFALEDLTRVTHSIGPRWDLTTLDFNGAVHKAKLYRLEDSDPVYPGTQVNLGYFDASVPLDDRARPWQALEDFHLRYWIYAQNFSEAGVLTISRDELTVPVRGRTT